MLRYNYEAKCALCVLWALEPVRQCDLYLRGKSHANLKQHLETIETASSVGGKLLAERSVYLTPAEVVAVWPTYQGLADID